MRSRMVSGSIALLVVGLLLRCGWAASDTTLDCLIEPYMVVNISSAIEGVLDTVAVDRGDMVKKGQVLATLESNVEQATIALARARAAMEAPLQINQTRLELSMRRHSRNEGLYARSLIPADGMDEVATTRRLAELGLQEATESRHLAELELQRVTAELTRRTIRSPINGVVVERFRHPGEFANEEPILKLAQLDPLRVEVFAPIDLLHRIDVSRRAEVRPEAPLTGVYEARVTVVDRIVDAASGTFGVRLEMPNRNYRLPAGLKCHIRFLSE